MSAHYSFRPAMEVRLSDSVLAEVAEDIRIVVLIEPKEKGGVAVGDTLGKARQRMASEADPFSRQ